MTAKADVSQERYLIVNADDFGQSEAINEGIIRAHEEGIVTATSFMPTWPAARAAAAYARAHPGLDLGLHVDLGEWACRNGEWYSVYEVLTDHSEAAVRRAVLEQLDGFRQLIGAEPSHPDSHQHVHRRGGARVVMVELTQQLGVPLRLFGDIHYCGDFYGQSGEGEPYPQALTLANLDHIFDSLPPGITEMACHPGAGADHGPTSYAEERQVELSLLCDARVRQSLKRHDVRLCSFATRPGAL